MRACYFRINMTKMWVHAEADCFWLILPPFLGWLQKFCNTDIVSLASARGILELPSVVFSVCQNRNQKLVICWHVFWQMYKLQIHKLVSRCDHLNISTMYSVFDWKEFEILSYRQAFLESTEISASEELNALEKAPAQFMALQILSGKGEVQFMPFQKLSGKCHFLLRFCTSNWSETYIIAFVVIIFSLKCLLHDLKDSFWQLAPQKLSSASYEIFIVLRKKGI